MRHRRWVLILAVVVLGVVPASLVFLRVATTRPSVRSALMARLVPRIDGDIEVGGLSFGLASVRFQDVLLTFDDGSSIRVPGGSASISYRQLIAGGFDPAQSLSTVILTEPHVTLKVGAGRSAADEASRRERSRRASLALDRLGSVLPDYLGVSGARVSILAGADSVRTKIEGLDLVLERTARDRLAGRANGSVLGDSTNLTATIAVRGDTLSVTGALERADLSPSAVTPVWGGVRPLAGFVSADFSFTRDSTGTELDLDVELDGVDVAVAGSDTVSGIRGGFSYDGRTVRPSAISGRWRGARIDARGGRISLSEGTMSGIALTVAGLDASRLADLIGGTIPELGGGLVAGVQLDGTFREPIVTFHVRSDRLLLSPLQFEGMTAEGAYRGGVVRFDRMDANVLGGEFTASGTITLAGTRELEARGAITSIELDRLAALGWADALTGHATLSDIVLEGYGDSYSGELLLNFSDVRYGELALGDGAGGVLVEDGRAYVSLNSRGMGYEISGEIGMDGPELHRSLGPSRGLAHRRTSRTVRSVSDGRADPRLRDASGGRHRRHRRTEGARRDRDGSGHGTRPP